MLYPAIAEAARRVGANAAGLIDVGCSAVQMMSSIVGDRPIPALAIPTFGDRRASGHSIIGLAVFGQSALHAEDIGRCWSQGRFLAWLAGF